MGAAHRSWLRFVVALAAAFAIVPLWASASAALPDGRAYEMVSPVDKGAADAFSVEAFTANPFSSSVFPLIASSDGEAVLFSSDGPFAGATIGGQNAYLSKRTATGWVTSAISPPSAIAHPTAAGGTPASVDATADLSTVMFGVNYEELFPVPDQNVLIAHGADGTNTQVDLGSLGGPGSNSLAVHYGGMSADGSHVVFYSEVPLESPVAPGDTHTHLYVWDRTTNTTSVVDILPGGALSSSFALLGVAGYKFNTGGYGLEGLQSRDAISSNGSRIFWSTEPQPRPLYAWIKGHPTVELSAAQCAGVPAPSCAASTRGAQFEDASTDGSQVFFISDGQLTNVAPNVALNQRNLYRYDFNASPGEQLTLISPQGLGSTNEPGTGLVGASQDGQVAYFVSEKMYEGNGVAGSPNLYVYDKGTVSFIATLSTVDKVLLVNKPYETSQEAAVQARVTPDGKHLVFQSFEELTLTAYDNAGHGEIYKVDLPNTPLPSTVPPSCISCGGPSPATADAELTFPSLTAAMRLPHNLSDDGQRVFFETGQSLVARDVNERNDVYEWNKGAVSLISGGAGPGDSYFIGATDNGCDAQPPKGCDVFFATFDQLVPSDTDTLADVYDARVGGGFPPAPPAPARCSGEECLGALSAPPLFGAPSSAAFAGAGNLTPVKPLTRAQRLTKALRACKKKPRKKRASCVRGARRALAAKSHATKSQGRGK
jgi:hypothetical protein